MNIGPKILATLFCATVVGAGVWQYNRLFVQQDFIVRDVISCDPLRDDCFVYACEEGEEDCDASPYAKIEKHASGIAVCVPHRGKPCPELECGPDDTACEITTCTEDNIEEGEACTSPEDYVDEEVVDLEETTNDAE